MNAVRSLSTWHRGRQARRAVWRQTTHRLLGVVGLDPAGNIVLRSRYNDARRGGWRAVITDGGRAATAVAAAPGGGGGGGGVPTVVPLHHAAAARLDGLIRAARHDAEASLAAGADGGSGSGGGGGGPGLGVVDVDGGIPVADRRLRLSRSATRWYLLAYRSLWLLVGLCGACQYFRMKQALPLYARCRLTELEAAVGETFMESTGAAEGGARGGGTAALVAVGQAAWAAAVEVAKSLGGYDPEHTQRDMAAAAALEAAVEAKRLEAAQRRAVSQRNWTIGAWTVSVAACIILFLPAF